MASRIDDLLTQLALAEHGVADDHPSLEHQRSAAFQRRFVLVGLLIHAALAEHTAGLVIDGREQMHSAGKGPQRAAQGLAVDAHRLELRRGSVRCPAPHESRRRGPLPASPDRASSTDRGSSRVWGACGCIPSSARRQRANRAATRRAACSRDCRRADRRRPPSAWRRENDVVPYAHVDQGLATKQSASSRRRRMTQIDLREWVGNLLPLRHSTQAGQGVLGDGPGPEVLSLAEAQTLRYADLQLPPGASCLGCRHVTGDAGRPSWIKAAANTNQSCPSPNARMI